MSVSTKTTHGFADNLSMLAASFAQIGTKIGKTIVAIREVHAESVKLQREMYKTYGLRAD
jgi:hypothetical protein